MVAVGGGGVVHVSADHHGRHRGTTLHVHVGPTTGPEDDGEGEGEGENEDEDEERKCVFQGTPWLRFAIILAYLYAKVKEDVTHPYPPLFDNMLLSYRLLP